MERSRSNGSYSISHKVLPGGMTHTVALDHSWFLERRTPVRGL
ncbi:MAG: hypothetical protein ACE5MM_07005 [Nitrospiraceae bacterium]